jgi:hypothetical protein
VEIPVAELPDFTAALRAVRAELQTNRRLARMPLARVLRLLGAERWPEMKRTG